MLFKFAIPLVVLLLSLFGGAVWLLDVNPLPQLAKREAAQKEATPEPATQPATDADKGDLEALKEALAPADAKSAGNDAPAFDIARIDPEGASVFAGTGEPNSRVTITADGETIGTADVDENGEWAVTIDKPIANPDAKLALFKASHSGEPSADSERTTTTTPGGAAADSDKRRHGGSTPAAGTPATAAAPDAEAKEKVVATLLSPPNIAGSGGVDADASQAAAASPASAASANATPAENASGSAAAVKADQMKNLEGMVAQARAAAEANGQAEKKPEAETQPHEHAAAAETVPAQQEASNGQSTSARRDQSTDAATGEPQRAQGSTADAVRAAADLEAAARADGDDSTTVAAATTDANAAPATAEAARSAAPQSAPARDDAATAKASGVPAASTAIAASAPDASIAAEAPPAATVASDLPQAVQATDHPTAVATATSDLPPDASAHDATGDAAKTSLSVPVPVTFVYNQATLTAEGRRAAGLLLEYLQIKRFPNVTLTGHADERGSHELNMRLSRERLEAVATFLREGGYDGPLELVPKGKTEPYMGVVRGDFSRDDLWQLDRRVELVISR